MMIKEGREPSPPGAVGRAGCTSMKPQRAHREAKREGRACARAGGRILRRSAGPVQLIRKRGSMCTCLQRHTQPQTVCQKSSVCGGVTTGSKIMFSLYGVKLFEHLIGKPLKERDVAEQFKKRVKKPYPRKRNRIYSRGPNRPVVKSGKIMFSLSRLFFFGITKTLGVDSCVFLILYDKS
jgi:hypothetical protein